MKTQFEQLDTDILISDSYQKFLGLQASGANVIRHNKKMVKFGDGISGERIKLQGIWITQLEKRKKHFFPNLTSATWAGLFNAI